MSGVVVAVEVTVMGLAVLGGSSDPEEGDDDDDDDDNDDAAAAASDAEGDDNDNDDDDDDDDDDAAASDADAAAVAFSLSWPVWSLFRLFSLYVIRRVLSTSTLNTQKKKTSGLRCLQQARLSIWCTYVVCLPVCGCTHEKFTSEYLRPTRQYALFLVSIHPHLSFSSQHTL